MTTKQANTGQKPAHNSMKRLVLNSAVAASVSGLGYSRQVYAGSCSFSYATNTYLCTGAASPTGTDNGQTVNGGNNLVVTSSPDFGLDNSNSPASADALRLRATGSMSVTISGNVTGNQRGISALNYGFSRGASTITTTGTVVGEGGNGIYARNRGSGSRATDLTINAVDVTGAAAGIHARNGATGNLSIITIGQVQGGSTNAPGDALDGIYARNEATGGDLTITANHSAGGHDGIDARNYGTGDVSVSMTGDLISGNDNGDRGVEVRNGAAGGAVTVDVATVVSEDSGVFVRNQGTGDLNISALGSVTSNGAVGGTGGPGFDVQHSGTGDIDVTASGEVNSNDSGFEVRHSGSGDVNITAGSNVTTGGTAIRVQHNGSTGSVNVTTLGDVDGQGSNGILVLNNSSGALTISSAGTVSGANDFRIAAGNSGTDLSVDLVNASGNDPGVAAFNSGTGDLSITSSGTVTATNGSGVYARNAGVNLTVDATEVMGTDFGLDAINNGTGRLTINAADVTGTGGDGIYAQITNAAANGDLSITTTGDIMSGRTGIVARHAGDGGISITTSGEVSGVDTGIVAETAADQLSVVDLRDGAAVSATSGNAISNNNGDGQITLRSGSSVAGSVRLNGGRDALIVESGADISAASVFDGGDGTEDILTFSGFSGAMGNHSITNWESVFAENGSDLNLNSSPVNVQILEIRADSSVTAGIANFTFGGDLQVNETGQFLAGAVGLGNVALNGNVLNNGLISLADGVAGDRLTFGGNLTGSGTIGLDVNLTNGTTDAVFVSGDSAGADQGLMVHTIGSTVDSAQTFTLVTVSGASTSSDFQLVNADFVTNDGAQAISDGAIAYRLVYDAVAGEFVLTPFGNSGAVTGNPGGEFFAASVQQFNEQLAFGTALQRFMAAKQRGSSEANTVSRALSELTSTTQPVVWVQAEGQRESYSVDDRDVVTNSGGLRFGAGMPPADLASGLVFGGLEFGVSSLSTDVTTSLTSADIDTDAYDVTLSALWISNSQLYVDGQLRYAIFDSTTLPNGGGSVDTDSTGFGLSVEVGKLFTLRNGLTLVPQAQLMYSDIDADDVTDLAGGGQTGSLVDGDTLTARLGLRAEHVFTGNSVLFGQVDYYHAFDNKTGVTFGNNTILTERGRNTAALTLGGYVALSDRTTFFGEISGETGLCSNSSDYTFGGNIGFEIRF